jgi:hypothetical protein
MKTLTAFSACLILAASTAWAAQMEHVKESIDAEGAQEIVVSLEFGAGELLIAGADQSEAAVLDIDYDARRGDYLAEYRMRGKTGYLDLETILRRHRDIDTQDNRWDVTLSSRYTHEVDAEIGASDAELELGGIPIRDLSLDIGAASALLTFDKPNPVRLEIFDMDVGAASLEAEMLGNANFERLNFSGGAGSFELDFRGEYKGESRVSIEVGLGSCDITLPDGVPVRIESEGDGWLSSIDVHGGPAKEIEEGLFESDGFERAETRLILEIEVGLGAVDIYFE